MASHKKRWGRVVRVMTLPPAYAKVIGDLDFESAKSRRKLKKENTKGLYHTIILSRS